MIAKNGFFGLDCRVRNTSTMKQTYYTVAITTPSGSEQDEKDEHFNWSHPMIEDQSSPSMKKDEIERAVCNHVRLAHTKQQRKHIVSICMSSNWFGEVQVEWKDNAEVVTIPKMKQTGSQKLKKTSAKKRRTFNFHFKNEPIKRFGVSRATLIRCSDGVEVNDDDPELNNADAWIELSNYLREHGKDYMMRSYRYNSSINADFGVEATTGIIEVEIEQEDEDDTIEFPPLQVTYKGIDYEFTFSCVDWYPMIASYDC